MASNNTTISMFEMTRSLLSPGLILKSAGLLPFCLSEPSPILIVRLNRLSSARPSAQQPTPWADHLLNLAWGMSVSGRGGPCPCPRSFSGTRRQPCSFRLPVMSITETQMHRRNSRPEWGKLSHFQCQL